MSVISDWGSSIISPHAWQRWYEERKKNMLIRMTHLNHTPPTLYLIHFLIRENEWKRTADLRWWREEEIVRERERRGIQSLPTVWLPISLQHGTYLSTASHAHEHLTLRRGKKAQRKNEAQSMPAHQGSQTRRHPLHPTVHPHCLPADNNSFSSNLGGCTKTSWHWIKHNTLQRNRTEQHVVV